MARSKLTEIQLSDRSFLADILAIDEPECESTRTPAENRRMVARAKVEPRGKPSATAGSFGLHKPSKAMQPRSFRKRAG